MLDVLTLCNYCILANVLDFRTYSFPSLGSSDHPSKADNAKREMWDYNEMSTLDRQHSTFVRGLARNLFDWISCNFDITLDDAEKPTSDVKKDVCITYLVEQACAILNYKFLAENNGVVGVNHCSFIDVERQLDLLLREEERDSWLAAKKKYKEHNSLCFGDSSFVVSRKKEPLKFVGTSRQPLKAPFTYPLFQREMHRRLGCQGQTSSSGREETDISQ